MFKGKFIAFDAYIRKEEGLKICYLSFHRNEKNRVNLKLKEGNNKDTIIEEEINELENKQ